MPTGSPASSTPLSPSAVRHWPSLTLFLGVLVLVLAADLLSKSLAFRYVAGEPIILTPENVADLETIPPHEEITLIPHVVALKLTVNLGAVFGLGQGQRGSFILISVVAVVVIGYIFVRSRAGDWPNHLAWGLILAGALGNLYDRVIFGGVRDLLWLFPHIDLPFGWRWPSGLAELLPWTSNTGPTGLYPWIFNIADVALLAGVSIVILVSWRRETRRTRAEKVSDNHEGTKGGKV